MKKYFKTFAAVVIGLSTFGFTAEAETIPAYYIESDLHLTKEGSPYYVEGDHGLQMAPGYTLTIDPGVTLYLSSGWLYLADSNIRIGSTTSSEKVVIDLEPGVLRWNGIYLDRAVADVRSLEIRNAMFPLSIWSSEVSANNLTIEGKNGNFATAIHAEESTLLISSSTIKNFGNKAAYLADVSGSINGSVISGNRLGIFYDGTQEVSFSGTGNFFSGNVTQDISNVNESTTLDFRGNDWGTGGAPREGGIFGKVITGYEVEKCCSSVVFIPGFMSSRLYDAAWERMWETIDDEKISRLFMNEEGESVDPGINSFENDGDRGVIDEAAGFNIYKKFLAAMDEMVSDGDAKIKEFKVLPYDWRKDIGDVADKMIGEIIQTAKRSNSGKVAIVAHSNGGLIGKILISKLREMGKEDLVESFVMVAVPQLGTPEAVAALLHGDGMTPVIRRETYRLLGENMKSAYTLLPSQKYFESVGKPVISFDESVGTVFDHQPLGDTIDSFDEFLSFTTSEDTRLKPSSQETSVPNILRDQLMNLAESHHRDLDTWVAPESVEVTQIAGWGIDTMSGIEYSAHSKFLCGNNPACFEWDRKPIMDEEGDSTVFIPSAILGENKSLYLNLREHNKWLRRNRIHKDIMEVESLHTLIKDMVTKSDASLPEYITDSKPVSEEGRWLRFEMHSPATMEIIDMSGNSTGESGQEIPNSYYMEFGEGKYAGVRGEEEYEVRIQGTGTGTFTFNVEEGSSGNTKSISFANVPVSTSTKAILTSVSDITQSTLKIDMQGDGVYEKEVRQMVDAVDFLKSLKTRIVAMGLDSKWEKDALKRIDKVIKSLDSNKKQKADALIAKYLEKIDETLKSFPEASDLQMIKDQLMLLEIL